RGERLVEHGDVDAILDPGPVGDGLGEIDVVVEDGTAQPRHGKVRSWRWDGGKPAAAKVAMVARHVQARKRLGSKKPCESKNVRDYSEAEALCALAARISVSMTCTCGEIAICLARQAGPGPRM